MRTFSSILFLMVLVGSPAVGRVVFSDDFSTGSGTLGSINGWSESGPEAKAYNLGGSGMLVLQDAQGDEKRNGAHAGYFDTLLARWGSTLGMASTGDWIRLSLDVDVFPGSYDGASVANVNDGVRISLTRSGATADAGYGIYLGTGSASSHSFQEMRLPASAQAVIGDALSGVDLPENTGMKRLVVRITRTSSGVELSGELAGYPLNTVTSTHSGLWENGFDTLCISVAAKDHGVRLDNVMVEGPELPGLWDQYVAARTQGSEPVLPDFSHAGYHAGAVPIPTVNWTVFDVTSFGAIADDGLSDKAAIKAAIAAAEANGSGIIFFPPGRFCINEPVSPWANDPIVVRGSRIVFRGSGRGAGGTELYGERHMDPSDPEKIWSCPKMIQFRGVGDRSGTKSSVVADARRETFTVRVANPALFSPGQWIQLTRRDDSPGAVAEAVAPYPVDPLWTSLIDDGVKVEEVHRIVAIDADAITFNEPIHADVTRTGTWSVVLFDALEEVGVEDLALVGNWTGNFSHHASFYHDSGWSGLQFTHVVDSWVRNCRFTDWSVCLTVGGSAAVTVSNLTLDGNKGHNALTFNSSSHCLAAMIEDTANHHHACGVAGRSSGNVFWKSSYLAGTCFEAHASQPRCTLFDNVTGGWQYGRWGGAKQNQPNHLRHLVFWNYRNIGSGESGLFKFMRPDSDYGRIIMPIVVGFHGNLQAFDASQVAALESNGTPVEPQSLFQAQYRLRTGRRFTELLFEEWAGRHGLDGADSALAADPDGDFRANLFEYGVGGEPGPGSNHPMEEVTYHWVDDGTFTGMEIGYRRRLLADPRGLAYIVEATSNLQSAAWVTAESVGTDINPVDDECEAVTTRASPGEATPTFHRLRIELTE